MNLVDKLRAFIGDRQYAYRTVFTGPRAEEVLADLAMFCRAHRSTFHNDSRMAAMLDGRREVWLRIVDHLNLTPEELFTLSTGKSTTPEVPMIDPENYHD